MRDLQDILKRKEVELERLSQEVEALRLVARLLSEESGGKGKAGIAGDNSTNLVSPAPRVKVFP